MEHEDRTFFLHWKRACAASACILMGMPVTVYGGWSGDSRQGWQYEENGTFLKDTWHWDGAWWYHLGEDGRMDTGWYQENGVWYYFYPEEGKPQGSAAGGWVEIQGLWYYFHPLHDGGFGAMAVNTEIDGYEIGADGSWNGTCTPVRLGPGYFTEETDRGSMGDSGGGSSGSSLGGSGEDSGSNKGEEGMEGGNGKEEHTDSEGDSEHTGEEGGQENNTSEAEKNRLREWEKKAALAEQEFLGEDWDMGHDWIVKSQEENDRRIAQMVSRLTDEERHEFYLIGLGFVPDTRCFARYPHVRYARIEEDEFPVNGTACHVVRVRFCRQGDEEGDGEPLPPDEDRIWETGDVQERELAGETYQFRCVDGEYGADGETFALFLCEEVLPSDAGSDEFERRFLTFGEDSNYKTSDIREWLKENGMDREGTAAVNVGVDTAYTGSTEEGTFGEADSDLLCPEDIGSQRIVDSYFCLSLEEALRYSPVLWSFEGGTDNPESQMEPYALGYWLRTPAYEEKDGRFCYGSQAYMVDLENGNLRPADTRDETVGMRPAYAVPQKGKMGDRE